MNKRILLTTTLILSLALMIGCSSSNDEPVSKTETGDTTNSSTEAKTETDSGVSQEGLAFEVRELGIKMLVPNYWEQNMDNIMPLVKTPEYAEEGQKELGSIDIIFIPMTTMTMINNQAELTDPDEIKAFNDKVMATVKPLVSIFIYDDKTQEVDETPEGLMALTGFDTNEVVGKKDGLTYVVSTKNVDVESLDADSQIIFNEAVKGVDFVKESIELVSLGESPQKAAQSGKIAEFESKDIKGNTVDNSIFKEAKVTMINVWGTYCGPCIEEMEDLQALSQEILEIDAQLIGIVVDGTTQENLDLANLITEKKGVTFTSIVPDNAINISLLQGIQAVPTSIFVDSDGQIIGEPIVGVRTKEVYLEAVKEVLKLVE